MSRRWKIGIAALALALALPAGTAAQQYQPDSAEFSAGTVLPADAPPVPATPVVLPRMSPELALVTYLRRQDAQSWGLASYSDVTVIEAELPDSSQKAEYELKRRYAAPKTLEYTPLRFAGDGFVRSNVIVRLLQADVDHVAKQEGPQTAIDEQNYNFKLLKSSEEVNGHPCWAFKVKPRKKRPGLFSGRVYIDMNTGALRRAEGSIVKSPSWWIKKVEFVQDYDEIGGFFLPVRLQSMAKARVIGRAVVTILHRDYEPAAARVTTAFGGGDGKTN
jgi:hypothetical protein